MSYKWDDKLTEKFLTLYRKHKCLWNPYSPNYKNCSVKNEAFRIVIEELNIPKIKISECLQQIEVIREKYKEEQLKAEKELKSGKLYTSKLPWFNLMSQMLCEVINDEENFSDIPVRIIPCNVAKEEKNKNPRTAAFADNKSANLLYKPEKYVESKSTQNDSNNYFTSEEELEYRKSCIEDDVKSAPEYIHFKMMNTSYFTGSKKLTDGQSRNNNLQDGSKVVHNDANDPWNRCPACGWETEIKNQEKTYDEANQINNHKEGAARINPEIEVPLRIKRTNIFDTSDNVQDTNQSKPPPLYTAERNHFNWKSKTPETDVMQNRKKVEITAGFEQFQDSREKFCDSMQQKKCNVTDDEVPHQYISKGKNSPDVMYSKKKKDVHYPRDESDFVKNVIMCPNHMNDIHQSQFFEKQLRNFEINQTNDCIEESRPNLVVYQDSFARQSRKISEFENGTDGFEDLPTKRYNSCIQKFGERTTKSSGEDEYEVCSQFKIIIPTSDEEDRNLEITGYGVRVINPQLSRYMSCPSSEIPKLAIGDVECACRNESSVSNRNVNMDSARYGNIIKLDINHKRSKESRAKKRLHKSAATYAKQEIDPENDRDSENDGQHKSLTNRKTQTDRSYENESIQTSRNIETRKFNYSKPLKDRGVPSMDGTSSCRAANLHGNDNFTGQHQSTLKDYSMVSKNTTVPPQIENSLSPEDRFNNTRIFLNVIVKILESDDSTNISENLQTTLDSMLERIEQVPMTGQNATEYHADKYDTQIATFNDTTMSDGMSTQYESLALNPVPANRQAKHNNPQKSGNKTVELSDKTADFRPQTVELDDTSAVLRPRSVILGEPDNAVNKEAGGNERESWPLNATNKSFDEETTRNEPPASLLDNTNTSVNTALDYTSEFLNEEPIASSSRRFREHRSPSQLTKDFLDVIKFTMMMDGVLQPTENGNKDCCKKPNN